MENKIVKVPNAGFVQFFYPNYVIRDKLTYADIDLDVIYTGHNVRDIKNYLSSRTHSFISVVGVPDIDFSNRKKVVEWLQSKVGKPISISDELLESYDEDYFLDLVKKYWVVGKWPHSSTKVKYTMYNLFQSIIEGNKATLQIYFELLNVYPPKVIEASFLTFLGRAVKLSDQNVSQRYFMLLKQVQSRCGNKIKPAIVSLATRKDDCDELAFINLVTDLR